MPLQPMITGARHMIAAGHYLAAEAGHAVLQAGGNVVDAGVAAGIALGIVHSDQVQFSGVAPMIIHLADRDETVTIAGLGGWPRAARLETFVEQHGGAIPPGVLRTVVPAAPDAWILALERYGTLSFGDVAAAAIRYAREGFTMHPVMAHYIDRTPTSTGAGRPTRRSCCPAAARRARASGSCRRISRDRCSSWSTRSARPARVAASPACRPRATPSTAATSRPPWCAITTTTAAG